MKIETSGYIWETELYRFKISLRSGMPFRVIIGIVFMVGVLFLPVQKSYAQIPWDFVNTQKVHKVEVPANLQLTINNKSLSGNDAVGLFYKSGSSFKCGGYQLWKNLKQTRLLKAYGETGPNSTGFKQGDSLFVKVWDNSRQCGVDAVQVGYAPAMAKPFFQDGKTSRWTNWEAMLGRVRYQDSILCLNAVDPKKPSLKTITRPLTFTASGGGGSLLNTETGTIKPEAQNPDTFRIRFNTKQCLAKQRQAIIVADTPSFSLNLKAPLCRGGRSFLQAQNLRKGWEIHWTESGASGDSLLVTKGGAYQAMATNQAGCKGTANKRVEVQELPTVALPFDSLTSCEPATVKVSTSEAVKNIEWSNGTSGPQTTVSQTQTLEVTKTDTNGCQQSDSLEALVSDPIHFTTLEPQTQPVTCEGEPGTIQFPGLPEQISGGTRPFTYQLKRLGTQQTTPEKQKPLFKNLETGDYRLKVNDQIGCRARTTKTFNIRKQQCQEPVVILGQGSNRQGYFISEPGKAKIYNRQGKLEAVLHTPAKWFGRDGNGRALPIGIYHVVVNNEQKTLVTLLR